MSLMLVEKLLIKTTWRCGDREMERPVWRPVCSSWLFLGQLPVGQLSAEGLCRRSEVSHQKLLLKTTSTASNNLQRSEENISEATEV